MRTYTPEQLREILDLHAKWLMNDPTGQRANLTRADLSYANLTRADLSYANLTRANLRGADLTDANLTDANLTRADLTRADLIDANLTDANLTDANLTRADLTRANLRGADLTDADLSYANLSYANLSYANLSYANLSYAILTRADLTDIHSIWGTIGNMAEIKSIQVDTWPVTYTSTRMQIGCQLHKLSDWWAFNDEQIGRMDSKALTFWRTWKPILQTIIAASPATPTEHTE